MRTSTGKCLCFCATLLAAGLHPLATLADAPADRYTITGGTVYDSKTKLTWQQTPSSTDITLTDAKSTCAGLGTTLGGSGWRVPTVKELATLLDYSRNGPKADPTAFPSLSIVACWTTTVSGYSSGVFVIEFLHGLMTTIPATPTNLRRVLCVR